MRLCLDTSAYSWFRRGHGPAVDHLATAEEVGIPTIVIGELRAGFRQGARADANEAELVSLLREPVVSVWNVDEGTTRHFAEIVLQLRRAGTPLPTNDIWIAAVAAMHGVPVLTYDAHFERIDRVASIRLRSPTAGP